MIEPARHLLRCQCNGCTDPVAVIKVRSNGDAVLELKGRHHQETHITVLPLTPEQARLLVDRMARQDIT